MSVEDYDAPDETQGSNGADDDADDELSKAEASGPKDFFDSPFTELDGRFLIGPTDWWDYLHDLDAIKHAPHRYAPIDEFPCYVTTGWIGGEWVHQTLGLSWVRYMERLLIDAESRTRARLVPGKFGQRARVTRRRKGGA